MLEFIGFIIFVLIIKAIFFPSNNQPPRNNQNRTTHNERRTDPPKGNNYRPTGYSRNPITFNTVNNSSPKEFTNKDIEGLQDAYSGEKLNLTKGIIQCSSCKVFYHKSSFLVLQQENSSQCVSCSSILRDQKYQGSTTTDGVNFNPTAVTLNNFKDHVGSVVTFQGRVVAIRESRRGGDFALMFENKSWRWGFKLVFFGGDIRSCGGAQFIQSLQGKMITVRGLIIKHRKYGYEIIISERSMIMDIQ